MHKAKSLLLASVAIALVGGHQALAAPPFSQPIVLAQAGDPALIAAAEAKVEAARAALAEAQAKGEGIEAAQQALDAALKELSDAQAAAAAPPPAPEQPPAAAEAPPPADQAPPPPAAAEAPPADQVAPPPAEAQAPPPPEAAPAPAAEAPKRKPKPPTDAAKAPPPADQTAPPPAEAQAPPPPPEAAPAPTAEGPKRKPKPPTDAAKAPPPPAPAPTDEANAPPPPAPAAPAEAPAQANDQPPANPPPPLTADGQPRKFDPSLLKKPHPRFGEGPKGDTPVQLPKQEADIPKGGEIDAGAGRTIVREDNGQVTIRHDDTERFRRLGGNVNVQKGPNGTTTSTVNRPGGVQVVTVRDAEGNILQRYRKDANGQIEVLIGRDEPQQGGRRPPPPPRPPAPNASFDFHVQLPPLQLNIPRNQYVVESSRASRQDLARTFEAPPVEVVERPYSLEEIRRSERIRDKVRRVDFDTVTFEFGSAVLPDDQIPQVQKIGEAMQAVLQQDPDQVFLIEGHTDAVGSDLANLALSDRRAETVAEILTYYFAIPPENVVTQGYGEAFLKVPTSGPERENRRVAFRNITSLMRTSSR